MMAHGGADATPSQSGHHARVTFGRDHGSRAFVMRVLTCTVGITTLWAGPSPCARAICGRNASTSLTMWTCAFS